MFEPSKSPSASAETTVRSKKTRSGVRSKNKKKQKNSKKKVRRRTERRRQQQRGGKFQRASLMFFSYTKINCRYGLAILTRQSNNHFKNTTVVHFSAIVDLATEISAILPLWRLKLSVYFHLGEYYWKDFSSPAQDLEFLAYAIIRRNIAFIHSSAPTSKSLSSFVSPTSPSPVGTLEVAFYVCWATYYK